MLMDRMGLIIPSVEQIPEVRPVAITEAEYEADLELARAAGCIMLLSYPDVFDMQHIAISPNTGSVTVWWLGKQEVEDESGGLFPTSQVPATGRNDGLSYAGVYRPTGLRRRLIYFDAEDVPIEDIHKKDILKLTDGTDDSDPDHELTSLPIMDIKIPR